MYSSKTASFASSTAVRVQSTGIYRVWERQQALTAAVRLVVVESQPQWLSHSRSQSQQEQQSSRIIAAASRQSTTRPACVYARFVAAVSFDEVIFCAVRRAVRSRAGSRVLSCGEGGSRRSWQQEERKPAGTGRSETMIAGSPKKQKKQNQERTCFKLHMIHLGFSIADFMEQNVLLRFGRTKNKTSRKKIIS